MTTMTTNQFSDSNNFKYTLDGNIAFNFEKTSWRNVLLNDMLIEDYINSENTKPSIEMVPVYKMIKQKKRDKRMGKNLFRFSRKKNIQKVRKNILVKNMYKEEYGMEYGIEYGMEYEMEYRMKEACRGCGEICGGILCKYCKLSDI